MHIYGLTEIGQKLARSTTNPDTNAWKIVHYLDNVGHSTPDQIASYIGLQVGEASAVIARLKRKGIVREEGKAITAEGY